MNALQVFHIPSPFPSDAPVTQGTYAFMSWRVLGEPKMRQQDVADDLELFFWVVLYTCLFYLETNLEPEYLQKFMTGCFHEDWAPLQVQGITVVTGGANRTKFVADLGKISGTCPSWIYQRGVGKFVRSMVPALSMLPAVCDEINEEEVIPKFETLEERIEYFFSKVPDCNIAKHDWFLAQIDGCLGDEHLWSTVEQPESRLGSDLGGSGRGCKQGSEALKAIFKLSSKHHRVENARIDEATRRTSSRLATIPRQDYAEWSDE